MKKLYDETLMEINISEKKVKKIFASGMVTSPYGLKEIPHQILPITINRFVDSIVPYYEELYFQREVYLIPGLKTVSSDIAYVNNVRGEEMEIFGVLEELKNLNKNVALVFPGSHTHIAYIEKDEIVGLLSNFTGELFHALKSNTILSPILDLENIDIDKKMVKKGIENVKKFGFNRAIYISHAMKIFNEGTELERFSYSEGVINTGVRESLEYYCENYWKQCYSVAIISDRFMYELYSTIFQGSDYIKEIIWLPMSESNNYMVNGLRKMIELRKVNYEK